MYRDIKDYRRFCVCIEDIIKLEDCHDCPHFSQSTIKLEDMCGYSPSNIDLSEETQ